MRPSVAAADKPSLCVINFNGERFLPETLRAILAQTESYAELLLIDNASTDASVALTRRDFPSVRILQMPDNRGPGAARNAGLREAIADRVLFIDNDVVPAPDCARKLSEAMARFPAAAIAAPRVLYADRPNTIQYDGADSHYLGIMIIENEGLALAEADTAVRQLGSIITAGFMVDRTRLPPDVAFDEEFFIYLEDHDFGLRSRVLGAEIIAVPDALCYHREGTAGLSVRREGKYVPMRVFWLIRNRWLLILKSYSLRSLLVLSPIFLVYELAQLAVVIKKGWLREWLRAAGWVLVSLPNVLRKRRAVQRHRCNPDRLLLKGGPLPFRDQLFASRFERRCKDALNSLVEWYWRGVASFV
jgi:GT2 family glycosyltransferase